jgi:hypothetical protein
MHRCSERKARFRVPCFNVIEEANFLVANYI